MHNGAQAYPQQMQRLVGSHVETGDAAAASGARAFLQGCAPTVRGVGPATASVRSDSFRPQQPIGTRETERGA